MVSELKVWNKNFLGIKKIKLEKHRHSLFWHFGLKIIEKWSHAKYLGVCSNLPPQEVVGHILLKLRTEIPKCIRWEMKSWK